MYHGHVLGILCVIFFQDNYLPRKCLSWRHQHVAAVLCWTEPPNSDRWLKTQRWNWKKRPQYLLVKTCTIHVVSITVFSATPVLASWRGCDVASQSNYRRWRCSATPFVTTNWTTSTCSLHAPCRENLGNGYGRDTGVVTSQWKTFWRYRLLFKQIT